MSLTEQQEYDIIEFLRKNLQIQVDEHYNGKIEISLILNRLNSREVISKDYFIIEANAD